MNKKNESFKDFALDQLCDLEGVEARRMFGGYGLYQDETFFGIVHKGGLYFKVDELTVGEYRRRKMSPFSPMRDRRSRPTIKCRRKFSKTRAVFVSGR